jgi:hypothetical protein
MFQVTMEISSIDKIRTLNKAIKKEGVQAARIEDTLSISTEGQKKAEWVEMLKKMPDMRADKVNSIVSKDPLAQPAILAEIARKIRSTF